MNGISVLTIVKNRQEHLINMIEGVRRSARQPDEMIIVDMSDEAVGIGDVPFPARVIRYPTQSLPLAAARNMAARASRFATLIFLDVDCIPLENMIGHVTDVLRAEDSLVCAEVRYLGAGDVGTEWDESSLLASGRSHPVRSFPTSGVRTEHNPGLFWSLAFGIRRASYEVLKGFDERFEGYGAEDTDFGFRARAARLPLRFLGGAIACHQHHAVYDPPLQHFTDIVANARHFKTIWERWPMEGWLDSFAQLGLIRWDSEAIEILRQPTRSEIDLALRS